MPALRTQAAACMMPFLIANQVGLAVVQASISGAALAMTEKRRPETKKCVFRIYDAAPEFIPVRRFSCQKKYTAARPGQLSNIHSGERPSI